MNFALQIVELGYTRKSQLHLLDKGWDEEFNNEGAYGRKSLDLRGRLTMSVLPMVPRRLTSG